MKPELEQTRTPEQLAEIFRQLAREPLTSLLTSSTLKYTGISTAETAMENLLSVSGNGSLFEQGAEKVMLAGDFAFLIETINDRLQKNEYGSRSQKPRWLVENLMKVFAAWAYYIDTLKKGVEI